LKEEGFMLLLVMVGKAWQKRAVPIMLRRKQREKELPPSFPFILSRPSAIG
jgi:hypothetical protein